MIHPFRSTTPVLNVGRFNDWGIVKDRLFEGRGRGSPLKELPFPEAGSVEGQALFVDQFARGRVGFFGTKAFLDGAVVNRRRRFGNLVASRWPIRWDRWLSGTAIFCNGANGSLPG